MLRGSWLAGRLLGACIHFLVSSINTERVIILLARSNKLSTRGGGNNWAGKRADWLLCVSAVTISGSWRFKSFGWFSRVMKAFACRDYSTCCGRKEAWVSRTGDMYDNRVIIITETRHAGECIHQRQRERTNARAGSRWWVHLLLPLLLMLLLMLLLWRDAVASRQHEMLLHPWWQS